MGNLQKTLDALQPYVVSIRYIEGSPVVDAVFKEGWVLPENQTIQHVNGSDELNYHVIYGDTAKVGIDDLLDYVATVIKVNQEKEKKQDLFRIKVDEMKKLFASRSYTKLQNLKFVFEDIDYNVDNITLPIETLPEKIVPQEDDFIEEEITQVPSPQIPNNVDFVDEKGQPIIKTEEDLEMEQEELRAQTNIQILQKKNSTSKIELPPRKKPVAVLEKNIATNYSDCECGENEACDKCIDSKGF